ncbi:MAG: DUF427 domain-containing protein [Caulobacteraceae bacterium]
MGEMRQPGPDHPITITADRRRMRAMYMDHVIADSTDAVDLAEANYPPVVYFPRSDVDMLYLGKTTKTSQCPFKGEASYYTLAMDGRIAENAAWSYENPYPAMREIAERIAFYPDVVEVYAVEEGPTPVSPDEVIEHTDEGDGKSQAEPWPPSVRSPDATA